MNDSMEMVEMGVLGRAQGIRGEIRVNWYGESPVIPEGPLWLQAGKQAPRQVLVTQARVHQGTPVIRLEGVTDRTAAEALRGQTVLLPTSALPPVDEEDYYLHELLGLTIVLDHSGETLGVLDHVLFSGDSGEQEIWAIITPDKKEVLLPAVPEFVPHIDVDAGVIRVTPPTGLLELYGVKE